MGKTIDQIINNEYYTRLNKALKDRSIEIAKIIRKEMNKLQINKIGDYKVCEVKGEEYLGMLQDYGEGYTSLERTESCYYAGDFKCWIEAATTKQRIQFLNAARSIFDKIDEIKNKRCADIESVLADTESFLVR